MGIDACVLIEAVLFTGTDLPSPRILEAAKRGVIQLLLVAQVEREARRALRVVDRESELDTLLDACLVTRTSDATSEQLTAYLAEIWAVIRDEPDAKIGVALRCSKVQPLAFVSSNHKDWRPTQRTQGALGGCLVLSPKEFARLILLI